MLVYLLSRSWSRLTTSQRHKSSRVHKYLRSQQPEVYRRWSLAECKQHNILCCPQEETDSFQVVFVWFSGALHPAVECSVTHIFTQSFFLKAFHLHLWTHLVGHIFHKKMLRLMFTKKIKNRLCSVCTFQFFQFHLHFVFTSSFFCDKYVDN